MRALLALVLTTVVLAGCTDGSGDSTSSASTEAVGPEDTLDVLGAWQSDEYMATDEALVLTLSDDNTYSISDSCIELPGRWQLAQGRVELTPRPGENVRCSEEHEWPVIAELYAVDEDELVPSGTGPVFRRLGG